MEYALRFTRVLMFLGYLGLMGGFLFLCVISYEEFLVRNRSLSHDHVWQLLGLMLLFASPYASAIFLAYMCTGRVALKPKDVR